MARLADIADVPEDVTIRGEVYSVRGIQIPDLIILWQRFPALAGLFQGGKLEDIVEQSEPLLCAIIAAGMRELNPDGERGAAFLALDERITLLNAVIRKTIRGGAGPFVETLLQLFNLVGTAAPQPAVMPPQKLDGAGVSISMNP